MPRNRDETRPKKKKKKAFKHEVDGACEECMHLGWFPCDLGTDRESIQKCDNCAVFAYDDDAEERARKCLAYPWPNKFAGMYADAKELLDEKDAA